MAIKLHLAKLAQMARCSEDQTNHAQDCSTVEILDPGKVSGVVVREGAGCQNAPGDHDQGYRQVDALARVHSIRNLVGQRRSSEEDARRTAEAAVAMDTRAQLAGAVNMEAAGRGLGEDQVHHV